MVKCNVTKISNTLPAILVACPSSLESISPCYYSIIHTGVIPKASSASRIQENSSIFDFELTSSDMDKLTGFYDPPRHFCWNPEGVA